MNKELNNQGIKTLRKTNNLKILTLQLQARNSRERPWSRRHQNIRKDIKQKEGSWWKENEELWGGKIQAEEEAWSLQDQTNEKAV